MENLLDRAPGRAQATDECPGAVPMTGAAVLIDTLLALGVDTVFGYPGGAVLPLYDALHLQPRMRRLRHAWRHKRPHNFSLIWMADCG